MAASASLAIAERPPRGPPPNETKPVSDLGDLELGSRPAIAEARLLQSA